MQLQLLNNETLLNVMGAAAQGNCARLANFAVGSVLRAVLQANAAVALWVQWLTMQVLLTTRAATSNGTDLDSWVGDYGLVRLPGVAATGQVVLGRYVATSSVIVPPGGLVRTTDGLRSFAMVTDPGNPAWSAAAGGYVFAPGVAAITVPVVAVAAGGAGNVQPGAIALLASAMPGVDAVSNPQACTGGLDGESDAALRVRASSYFASLSRATLVAVEAAVAAVQQGLSVLVQENTPAPGQFVVVVDDGSGNPGAALLAAVYAAVDAVRPIGTSFTVQGPVVLPVAVAVRLTTSAGSNQAAIAAGIAASITAVVNALPIGATLPITRIAAIAYNAAASVVNVAVTLNGGGGDVVPAPDAVVRSSSVTVV